MPFGVKRREAILKWLEDCKDYEDCEEPLRGLLVNTKYVMWSLDDPDIKYLLKHKKVKRVRLQQFSVRKTYIVLEKS